MKALIFISLFFSITQLAHTKEYSVTKIYSDSKDDFRKSTFAELVIKDDDETKVPYELILNYRDLKTGQILESENKTINSFNDSIVIQEIDGFDVVTLSFINFIPESGGNIKLNFLKNAVTQNRFSLNMKFIKTNDQWQLIDSSNNTPVAKMFFYLNTIFGQEVGISSIKIN